MSRPEPAVRVGTDADRQRVSDQIQGREHAPEQKGAETRKAEGIKQGCVVELEEFNCESDPDSDKRALEVWPA